MTKTNTKKHSILNRSGFTLVELLIVMVVIAIMATLSVVAYNGIQQRGVRSQVQSTASSIAQAMMADAVDTGAYATTLPTSVTLGDGIGVAFTEVASTHEFCVNVVNGNYPDITYHVDQTGVTQEGLCEGAVVATSGNYVTTTQPDPTVMSSIGSSTAPGDMAFTITTNETWTSATLSWQPVAGATAYRINTKDSSTSTWYVRYLPDGNNSYAWDYGGSPTSGWISPSTTSLTWTKNLPTTVGQSYDFRIQSRDGSGNWSAWQETSLSPLDGRYIPQVANFTVTPASDWSTVEASWDSIGTFANLPAVKFRVNTRIEGTDTWYARYLPNGSGSYAWNYMGSPTTGIISATTTSLPSLANAARPATAMQKLEYRIQIYSGSYEGPWSYFTLDPLNGAGQLPAISNFTVTPNGTWSQVTMSWDSLGSNQYLPGLGIRINTRTSPTATWYARYLTNGSGSYAWNFSGCPTTTCISKTSTSQVMGPGSIPGSGSTYEYRIQTFTTDGGEGPWSTFSLTH